MSRTYDDKEGKIIAEKQFLKHNPVRKASGRPVFMPGARLLPAREKPGDVSPFFGAEPRTVSRKRVSRISAAGGRPSAGC